MAQTHHDLKNVLDQLSSETIDEIKEDLEKNVSAAFFALDEQLNDFVKKKFDDLAMKMVDMLITRKFKEEVERRVNEELQKRGKF